MSRVLTRLILLAAPAACLLAQPASWTVVSAASYRRDAAIAPEMIMTGFSAAIAATATLAGYSVLVRDANAVERPASLYRVDPGQIGFVVPASTAQGNATLSLRGGENVLGTANAPVAAVAPGLFTANSSGAGAPAGYALFVSPDSRRHVDLFQASTGGGFLPRPIETGAGEVYLSLFGTGIRGWRTGVTAAIAGKPVPVTAAVAQATYAGLDQVNLGPLAADVGDRRGELPLVITVDGVAANAVTVALNPPALGAWGTRGNLLEANSELAVGELDGKIYALGGYPSSRQTQTTVQVYDPVEDRWERTTPLPIPLNHNMAAAVNGKL